MAKRDSNRMPWFKLHSGDWRRDPQLRLCSLAARGLWIDLLTLMHEAAPRGELRITGKAPTAVQLARLLGAAVDEVEAGIAELVENGVASVRKDGTIFSRRMVRDDKRERTASASGKRGAAARYGKNASDLSADAVRPPGPTPWGYPSGDPMGVPMGCDADHPMGSITDHPMAKTSDVRRQTSDECSLRSQSPAEADDAGPPDDDKADRARKVEEARKARKALADDLFSEFQIAATRVGWSVPKVCDEKRRKHLLARVDDSGGAKAWRETLDRASRSAFLTGRTKGWAANFDWLMKPTNWAKVSEGAYDNRPEPMAMGPRGPVIAGSRHGHGARPSIVERLQREHEAIEAEAQSAPGGTVVALRARGA